MKGGDLVAVGIGLIAGYYVASHWKKTNKAY